MSLPPVIFSNFPVHADHYTVGVGPTATKGIAESGYGREKSGLLWEENVASRVSTWIWNPTTFRTESGVLNLHHEKA